MHKSKCKQIDICIWTRLLFYKSSTATLRSKSTGLPQAHTNTRTDHRPLRFIMRGPPLRKQSTPKQRGTNVRRAVINATVLWQRAATAYLRPGNDDGTDCQSGRQAQEPCVEPEGKKNRETSPGTVPRTRKKQQEMMMEQTAKRIGRQAPEPYPEPAGRNGVVLSKFADNPSRLCVRFSNFCADFALKLAQAWEYSNTFICIQTLHVTPYIFVPMTPARRGTSKGICFRGGVPGSHCSWRRLGQTQAQARTHTVSTLLFSFFLPVVQPRLACTGFRVTPAGGHGLWCSACHLFLFSEWHHFAARIGAKSAASDLLPSHRIDANMYCTYPSPFPCLIIRASVMFFFVSPNWPGNSQCRFKPYGISWAFKFAFSHSVC